MKFSIAAAALLASINVAEAKPFDEMFPNHEGYEEEDVNAALRAMDFKQGAVALPGGQAQLQVPEGFYYLDPKDASAVLVDLWGNPYGSELGMIFPAYGTPWDYIWGADISFEDIGYVSDEDAESYDYDALLVEMKAEDSEVARERESQGIVSYELLGWAEQPGYNRAERKLYWGMELKFSGSDHNTLNYELRALGREGVLNANFIANIDQLQEVKAAMPEVSAMISFVEGKTYADFNPSVDKVAAVGVAGLIAGKVLTSKAGLFAVALLFLKKFWFVLLVPLMWAGKLFRRG